MELSGSNIKKFLIFSQKKPLLIFQEMETPPSPPPKKKNNKKCLFFRKWKFLIVQGTEALENFLYFSKAVALILRLTIKQFYSKATIKFLIKHCLI